MLITVLVKFGSKGLWEPRKKDGTLNPVEHLVWFEPEPSYSITKP